MVESLNRLNSFTPLFPQNLLPNSSKQNGVAPTKRVESAVRALGASNKPLQTDDRRASVVADSELNLAPLAAERQAVGRTRARQCVERLRMIKTRVEQFLNEFSRWASEQSDIQG